MVDPYPRTYAILASCFVGLTHRIVDRVPVVELECIAPPIKSLSDKRREVAAGWRSTAIDDSKLPPSASFQAGAPSQQHRSADEHALVALCPRNHALHGFVASSTYQCDVCSASLVPGATAFGCRRCDFDLCSQCYHEPLLQNCPGNHGLCHSDPADRRDLVFTCDLCDKPIPASGTTNGVRGGMYSCRECDFDICASCHRDPARAKCPGHHELKGSRTTDDGYRCDRCSKNCPAQTLLYRSVVNMTFVLLSAMDFFFLFFFLFLHRFSLFGCHFARVAVAPVIMICARTAM